MNTSRRICGGVMGAGLRAGMTLMEVLIAVTILGTVMIIVWASFSYSFDARERVETVFERYQIVRQGMARMSTELSMAFVTPHGTEPTGMEQRYKTAFIGKSERIDFTSLSHQRVFENEKSSDQCEISYYVRSERNEEGDLVESLVRREDTTLDDDPEKGGTIMTLIPDIEEFELEYWDDQKEIAGEAWTDEWDTEGERQGQLPQRVRITIEFEHPLNGKRVTMRTQTQLYLLTPLTF